MYKKELNMLLENENNIKYFVDLVLEDTIYTVEQKISLIIVIIDFCNINKKDYAKSKMLYYLGWCYIDNTNLELALQTFIEGKKVCEDINFKEGLAYIYNGLVSLFIQLGLYNIAVELSFKGICLALDSNSNVALLKIITNFAMMCIECQKYNVAKEMLDFVGKRFLVQFRDRVIKYFYLKAMSCLNLKIGKLYEAKQNIIYSIKEISSNNEDVSFYNVENYRILGMIESKYNNYDIANEYFINSYELSKKYNFIYERCETLIEWAKFKINIGYYEDRNEETVVRMLDEVIRISEKVNINKFYIVATNTLYEYFKSKGDFENALFYLEKSQARKLISSKYISIKIISELNIDENKINLNKLLFVDKIDRITKIGKYITSQLDIKKIVKRLDESIGTLIPKDYFGITTIDNKKDDYIFYYYEYGELKRYEFNLKDDIFNSYCIRNNKNILINDITKDYKKYVNREYIKNSNITRPMSMIFIPLEVDNKVIGSISVQSIKINAYSSDDINILKIIGNYVSIAIKNAIEYEIMRNRATYDSLTGLLTKSEIFNEGNKIVENFKLNKEVFCIFMIDINNFGKLNRMYGQIIGDEILKSFSSYFKELVRPNDIVGRYGGDEFIVICPKLNYKKGIFHARNICENIKNYNFKTSNKDSNHIEISAGVFEYNNRDLSFIDAISEADVDLYKNKNKRLDMKN